MRSGLVNENQSIVERERAVLVPIHVDSFLFNAKIVILRQCADRQRITFACQHHRRHGTYEFRRFGRYSLLWLSLYATGTQALSRSLFARLIPPEKSGEYFGFYNMLGKFSSILGPVLAGTVALISGSQRVAILSIVMLFVSGLWLLTRVQVPSVRAPA